MSMKRLFSSPPFVLGSVLAASVASLSAALIAEGFLGLEPCQLCIYQRYPFAAAAALGLIGLLIHKKRLTVRFLLVLCALLFLGNSALAYFHSGVELHWWKSPVEGCSVVFDDSSDTKTLLENIMSAPTGHCDEIPWADPYFDLSMANYNVIWSFILFLFCAMGVREIRKYPPV